MQRPLGDYLSWVPDNSVLVCAVWQAQERLKKMPKPNFQKLWKDVNSANLSIYSPRLSHYAPADVYAVIVLAVADVNPSKALDAVKQGIEQQNEREAAYRYNQNEQYDLLVKELFCKFHHMADQVNICFAKRGNKSRDQALRRALEKAEAAFEQDFGFNHPADNAIVSSTPPKSAGLQAVDYFLWALQRFYERREARFLEMVWPQVGEIHDLDRVEKGRRGVFYTKQKPLNLAALGKKERPGI